MQHSALKQLSVVRSSGLFLALRLSVLCTTLFAEISIFTESVAGWTCSLVSAATRLVNLALGRVLPFNKVEPIETESDLAYACPTDNK